MAGELLTFDEALTAAAETGGRPHVLLGNGFSQACKGDVFAYDALLKRADFRSVSQSAWEAFDAISTTDFEEVMRSLASAADLLLVYDPKAQEVAGSMEADAAGLQDVLISAIAESHPDVPGDVTEREYAACRQFLSHFQRIFTLNYDLLLYWTLMQDVEPSVSSDDGFRTPEDEDALYVTWEPSGSKRQNVYYLHGALHLFDAGHEMQKYTWINTGVRLIDQVREAMADGKFPLFVSEGTSEQKLRKIRHSDYLSSAERSLSRIGGKNALFVFGHSLASPDDHVLRCIVNNSVQRMFLSIYGDPESESNRLLMTRAAALRDRRGGDNPLSVDFYSAESANVWGRFP